MNSFLKSLRLLDGLSKGLAAVELFACNILIVCFAVLLFVNVISRYVFSAPLYFAEEAAVYMLIIMTYLAVAATIARLELVALSFMVDYLPLRLRLFVNLGVQILILAMVCILLATSWAWATSSSAQYDLALTLGMKKWPFYMIMPLFFGLATIHTTANLLDVLAHIVLGYPPSDPDRRQSEEKAA